MQRGVLMQCAAIICTHPTSRSGQALRGAAARPVLPLHFPPSQLLFCCLNISIGSDKSNVADGLSWDIQCRLGVLNTECLNIKLKGFGNCAYSTSSTQCGQKEQHTGTYLYARPSRSHNIAFLAKNFFEFSLDVFVVPGTTLNLLPPTHT